MCFVISYQNSIEAGRILVHKEYISLLLAAENKKFVRKALLLFQIQIRRISRDGIENEYFKNYDWKI